MNDRYYSSPGRQAISIRLVLIIVIPLLVVMLSWLYISRDKDSKQLKNGQPTVQALDIPNQLGTKIKEFDDTAPEPAKKTSSEQTKNAVKPESQAETVELTSAHMNKKKGVVLPMLEESDSVFRQDVMRLNPEFFPLVNAQNLLRLWLVSINDLSQNLRPYKHFQHFKLSEPFQVATDESGDYIAEQSFQRYNALVKAVDKVETKEIIGLFKKFRPLLQQVFVDFNYPETDKVEDVINKAASNILQAPILEGKIRVVKSTLRYKFADQNLEALSPVQKQMIRMGPENTRIVQNKLRKLMGALANVS